MLLLDTPTQIRQKTITAEQLSIARSRATAGVAREKAEDAISPDGDISRTNPAAQMGRPMHAREVIKRLLTLNPNLYFEVAKADSTKIGIYMRDPAANLEQATYRGIRYLGVAMENDMMPEFNVILTKPEQYWDEQAECIKNRPVWAGEKRGWRTVLARLIKGKYINLTRAELLFGRPTRNSKNWWLLFSQ